ncbi:siphovirus ReqiPepy6 Gp37-like family protein [Diplocloster modestus]|uniref:Siphovirus ReqiPepy6 Gp37-like family protein n=1 Tax=Diplocloster modestus TaxID=2850322 RepID=A0ABS6KCM6_9FIRM|nr:siphovirus ReqiPepy6 Gp37-like family protein [Diplocloster modestus]MBU9728265.1 siphovirus ReqiPepy6 Gp37-like family protein [Diplocloster modestus]
MSVENKVLLCIYDENLDRKGIIDVFRSLIWTRKYYECGNFELHVTLNEKNLKLLTEGSIVSKRDIRRSQGKIEKLICKESGIVEGITIDDTVNEITAIGRFLSSILDRRVIRETINFNGKTEVGMRTLVSSVTKIPFLQLGELYGSQEIVAFQVSYKELYGYICKLSKYSNLGFRIRADYKNKLLLFEVYCGIDRSENQRDRSRVTFSEIYKNLNGVSYVYNDQNTKTCAIVAGEGEGNDRVVISVGGGSGWDLREAIVDARDVQKNELTDVQYKDVLSQRGHEKLAEYGVVECLEAETKPMVNFEYKKDYELGDIVTVRKKDWGIEADKRITEVQEVYENGSFNLFPTFGDPLPEKIDLES